MFFANSFGRVLKCREIALSIALSCNTSDFINHSVTVYYGVLHETKYSRIDQVKFVEDSL